MTPVLSRRLSMALCALIVAGASTAASAAAPAKAGAKAPAAKAPAARPAAVGPDAPAPKIPGETKLRYGAFGEVSIYKPAGKPRSVAIFVSGDGGWNLGVVDMARHLLDLDAVVVGIDIRTYRKAMNTPGGACKYFGADFEGLAHEVEQRLHLTDYLPPVLVGYSSGATLVYAAMVQAPKGTFSGVMSLGFCPDLDLTQPVCRSNGLSYETTHARGAPPTPVNGVVFAASKTNATPWVVFQGQSDQVCNPPATRAFVAATHDGELVWLPKVGHGFSVEKNWLPQFKTEYARLAGRAAPPPVTVAEVRDLPLVEVPASGTAAAGEDQLFAVLLTGDGGWAGIDQDVGGALAARGIPVVGLNTLKYFWATRTPEVAAHDLERIIRRYALAWHRPKVLLVGYSFGADVLPFLYTRLPADLRVDVRSVNLLGLSDTATFEFHVSDWIPGMEGDGRPTAPEIARMQGVRVLCLYGVEEEGSPCPKLTGPQLKSIGLPGGHHFDGDFGGLVRHITDYARN